ncbi:MAG: metallophosphoesterase [Phycisphaerales bacterium]|nr:metallophosphoesterase [Phycisphaerales bacterium]
MQTDAIDLRRAEPTAALFNRAAETLLTAPFRVRSTVRLPATGRLLATGDLHDNPVHLAKIRRLARLEAAPDHHVVLHEMIHSERLVNGVDLSYRVLGRVAELVTRYPAQVHPLLANHELAQMTGKGVSKGAGNNCELFDAGLEFVFGDDWAEVADAIDAFIRAMPLALVSASGVLCAHSVPAARDMDRFDLGVLDRDLVEADYESRTGAAYLMTWGRGHDAEHLARLADAWDVRLFCLGHEHAETGFEARTALSIILNSDHEHGAVLPIDLAAPPTTEDAAYAVIPLGAISAE